MKQDRFLNVILGITGLLVIFALVIFFVRQNFQSYSNEDTPEGVIRNYVLAINLGDYEKAYGYVASGKGRPNFEQFEHDLLQKRPQMLDSSVRIISTEVRDGKATVILNIAREGSEPFESPRSYTQTAELIFQDGIWKIVRMPYSLWH